jgi:hypothetical protein
MARIRVIFGDFKPIHIIDQFLMIIRFHDLLALRFQKQLLRLIGMIVFNQCGKTGSVKFKDGIPAWMRPELQRGQEIDSFLQGFENHLIPREGGGLINSGVLDLRAIRREKGDILSRSQF